MTARRRGLGRGLDALIKAPEPEPRQARLEEIEPNQNQPRSHFDDESIGELADSIRAQGLVQPIVVTPRAGGGYTIVAGERRWRAARLAGLDEVPVVVRGVSDEQEMLELALVENLQRTDLDPIEEARAYEMLRERFGLSQDEIAHQVGKGRPTVANALRLLKLPESVQELMTAGRLSAGQARPLLRLRRAADQEQLARRSADDGLTAREVERLTKAPAPRAAKPRARPEPHAAAAAEALTKGLQTKVEIVRKRRGGVITIHFHSEEELIRLFERLAPKTR